jgi:ribose 5-phosphate isomerase A
MEKTVENVAVEALHYVQNHQVIGVGTGSIVNLFIEQVAIQRLNLKVVPSSTKTIELLLKWKIPVASWEDTIHLPVYIDEVDAYNNLQQLIKVNSSSLVKGKILANASRFFICFVKNDTTPAGFHKTAIPVEVLPSARSYVARCLVKLGGKPIYRNGFVTENNNIIIDTYYLPMHQPIALEEKLNNIPGVVANGIFAARHADLIIK